MGFGGISIWQLLIVLVIVLVLFGAKKLRNVGSDLGGAIKDFKKSMGDEEAAKEAEASEQIERKESGEVIEAEVSKDKDKAET